MLPIDSGAGGASNPALLRDPHDDPAKNADTPQNDTKPYPGMQNPNGLRFWTSGPGLFARPALPDPAEAAQRVMDTGVEWGTDDYDARLDALARELGRGDATYQAKLMGEIFKKDPGAMQSWLTPERANHSGRISIDERKTLAEGMAAAYNHGQIPHHKLTVGVEPGKGGDHSIDYSALDGPVHAYTAGYDKAQNAQRVREFFDFMESSEGPEATKFRQNYARHLIDNYVLDVKATDNVEQRNAAAGLAANLMGGDIGHPEIATRLLAQYSPEQRKTILDTASYSSGLYGEESLKGDASARQIDPRDICLPDGGTMLMLAVAGDRSPAADKLAIEMARLPGNSPSLFEGFGGKNRVDAMTLVVSNHSRPVLDALTNYDNHYIGDEKNPSLHQFMQNASDLGALFKLTMFNPDSHWSKGLQDEVVEYSRSLAKTINEPGANGDEANQLAMLQAGVTDGVRKGYQKLADDDARQKEAIGFLLDLGFAAVPVGKWTSGAMEKGLVDMFGDSPAVREALKTPLEQMVDKTTGKLTDQGKKAILDSLGKERGNLEIFKSTANQLNEAFINQIDKKDYDRNDIKMNYNVILDGIDKVRNREK
jgi:hypothetical protein